MKKLSRTSSSSRNRIEAFKSAPVDDVTTDESSAFKTPATTKTSDHTDMLAIARRKHRAASATAQPAVPPPAEAPTAPKPAKWWQFRRSRKTKPPVT